MAARRTCTEGVQLAVALAANTVFSHVLGEGTVAARGVRPSGRGSRIRAAMYRRRRFERAAIRYRRTGLLCGSAAATSCLPLLLLDVDRER